MQDMDGTRPWWRRLVAALAPAPVDIAQRLAGHYAAEIRLAHGLVQDAEFLSRYPNPRARILDAGKRARGRGQRIRLALEGLRHPVTEPATRSGPLSTRVWERLHASISELSSMSETYLANAHGAEREHPDIAGCCMSATGTPPETGGI